MNRKNKDLRVVRDSEDVDKLVRRIMDNTEDEETIQKRLAVARQEMETARDYDYVIVNDTIEHTVEQINKIIAAEKNMEKVQKEYMYALSAIRSEVGVSS